MPRLQDLFPDSEILQKAPAFRLSRDERDYVAGHALDSIKHQAYRLYEETKSILGGDHMHMGKGASSEARKIAALSNLLGDIGWIREGEPLAGALSQNEPSWHLGELFPVAQLRPWLEGWVKEDNEILVAEERGLEVFELEEKRLPWKEGEFRKGIARAQTKLGTGAILLARIEKWMASHGN